MTNTTTSTTRDEWRGLTRGYELEEALESTRTSDIDRLRVVIRLLVELVQTERDDREEVVSGLQAQVEELEQEVRSAETELEQAEDEAAEESEQDERRIAELVAAMEGIKALIRSTE